MTLPDLIAQLESATGPNFELEQRIGEVVGFGTGIPPAYTVILDAKLPIENDGWWEISGPRRHLHIPMESPSRWRAVLTLWNPAREFVGWGYTEALARRIAALKAIQHDLTKSG